MPRKTYEQKLREYDLERQRALQIANSLPVKTLTLEQATALLPNHPEWTSKETR